MVVFLQDQLRPGRADLKLLQAVTVEVAAITGLAATDVQAALVELLAAIPKTATAIPSAAVGNLVSTNVQAALAELQAEIDTFAQNPITAAQQRALQNITEGTADTYTDVANATLARSDGLNPPAPFGGFIYPYTTAGTTSQFFFDVPTATSLANVVIRRFAIDSSVISEVSVADATTQSGAAFGFQRYLTTQSITIVPSDTLRLETKVTTFDTYTLAAKYRVPASTLTGGVSIEQLDTDLRSELNSFDEQVLSRTEKLAIDQQTVNETIPTTLIANVRYDLTQRVSHDISDYTAAAGNAVPVVSAISVVVLVLENEAISRVEDLLNPGTVYPFVDLGLIISGFRGYRITYPQGASLGVAQIFGGVPVLNSVTLSDKVTVGVSNLSVTLAGLLVKAGHAGFFDHIFLQGDLTFSGARADFYYLAAASLPERTLTNWTHVTNSQVPQIALTTTADYIILLPSDLQPDTLTWDPDSTQPAAGPSDPSQVSVKHREWVQVLGSSVPAGFSGWRFRMPEWNAASAARTGARLTAGILATNDIDRIDLASQIKVTDQNLDIKGANTFVPITDQRKLDAIHLATFSQPLIAESAPNSHFQVLLASAWPDPDVDYRVVNTATHFNQRAGHTGIVEGDNGVGTLFNLISNSQAVFGTASPANAGANNNYRSLTQGTGNTDTVPGPGLIRGEITATDTQSVVADQQLRIDDVRGLAVIATLHIGRGIQNNQSFPIFTIGDPSANQGAAMIIKKDATGKLLVEGRVFTGSPSSTTRTITDTVELHQFGFPGPVPRSFVPPGGSVPVLEQIVYIIPNEIAAPASINMRMRTLFGNADFGEQIVDLPANIASLTSFTSDIAAQTFRLENDHPFTVRYDAPGGSSSSGEQWASQRALVFQSTLTDFSNYIPRLFTFAQRTITVPAGSTRDISFGPVLNTFIDQDGFQEINRSGGEYEIGFYVQAGAGGQLEYKASINGTVTALNELTGENAPVGRVPVTFGSDAGADIGMSRMLIIRPREPLENYVLASLTEPTVRNRANIQGLVRFGGESYTEAFTTGQDIIRYRNSTDLFLPNDTKSTNEDGYVPVIIEQFDGPQTKQLRIGSDGSFFSPNTDLLVMIHLHYEIEIDISQVITAGVPFRSSLQFGAQIQQRPPGGTGYTTVLNVQPLGDTIERSLIDANRIEVTTAAPDPRFGKVDTQFLKLLKGLEYRFRVRAHRVNATGTTSPWPTTDTLIHMPKQVSEISFMVFPTT